MASPQTITLYSKPGCHLCEDLRALVDELQPAFGFVVEEIDITRDAELFARYRHEIPVLLMEGMEIARGKVDERDLLSWLENATSP